jgi:methionyl-tRNA synthetase
MINNLPTWTIPILIVAIIWTLFWKGAALWHAARTKNKLWFFILLLVNSLGILEVIYLFAFAKVKTDKLFK